MLSAGMCTYRRLAVSVVLAGLVALACPMPASAADLDAVLARIPADAMGFVVMPSVQGFTTQLDQYMQKIGLSDVSAEHMPQGSLKALQEKLSLGEGFDPSGCFAFAMLNPKTYGIDLQALMDDPSLPRPEKLPIVVFVPGSSVAGVFGNEATTQQADATVVNLPMGPMYAIASDGMVILSPMQEALAAVKAQAQTPVTTLLAGDQAKVIKERAISVFGNVDQVGPLLITMMQKQQETMSGLVGVPEIIGAVYKAYLPVYQQMVSQTKGVVIAGGWNDTGLLIDEVIAFKDGSELAKAMASLPQGGPWLNRLPDINYVLAAGGAGSADNPGPVVSLATDMIQKVLGNLNVQQQTKDDVLEIAKTYYEQVKSAQLVIGGAPDNAGVFGASLVLVCKDPEVVRGLIEKKAGLSRELLLAVAGEAAPELKDLTVTYVRDVAIVNGKSIDAIEFHHPAMDTAASGPAGEPASQPETGPRQLILGENAVRIYVVKATDDTVVVTIGGAQAFLAKAMAVADGSGTIPQSPGVQQVMGYLFDKPLFVYMFDVKDLLTVIKTAATTLGAAPPPFELTTQIPVGMAGKFADNVYSVRAYIPNELVNEAVKLIKGFTQQMQQNMTSQPASKPSLDEF